MQNKHTELSDKVQFLTFAAISVFHSNKKNLYSMKIVLKKIALKFSLPKKFLVLMFSTTTVSFGSKYHYTIKILLYLYYTVCTEKLWVFYYYQWLLFIIFAITHCGISRVPPCLYMVCSTIIPAMTSWLLNLLDGVVIPLRFEHPGSRSYLDGIHRCYILISCMESSTVVVMGNPWLILIA